MKQSGYLARQKTARKVYADISVKVEKQFMVDTMQILLHRHGFGYDRVKKLTEEWNELYKEMHPALEGGMEADVQQEHMDRELRSLVKDRQEFFDFAARYPEIDPIRYDRPHREMRK